MKFEWDEQKNQANIKKHGLDFGDAYKVFEYPMLVNLDNRKDYGEERWIGIGLMDTRVVVILFAEPDEDTIRVISLRKATSNERKRYEQVYKDEFGTS
jgi:uncharacterized DUF497 family protein